MLVHTYSNATLKQVHLFSTAVLVGSACYNLPVLHLAAVYTRTRVSKTKFVILVAAVSQQTWNEARDHA